jgi:hypothetical protein
VASRFTPAVGRRWLFGIAGAAWTIAGLILLAWSVVWLGAVDLSAELELGTLGLAVAFLAGYYGFSPIVLRNISRIEGLPDRACAFSFQAWRSYLVMGFMIALGVTLRHSAFPKPALAVVYLAIGGALIYASGLYHRRFARALRGCEV